MPHRTGLLAWADLLYAPPPPVPAELLEHVETRSVDPLRWKLATRDNVALVSRFTTWRRTFIHTVELGPVADLDVLCERITTVTGQDYPLNRPRSFDQATLTAAWVAAQDCVDPGERLRATVDRLGAAAALSRALTLSVVLRHGAHAWPQTTHPVPDPLPFGDTADR